MLFIQMANHLFEVQPNFKDDLISRVENFKFTVETFQEQYDNEGPMVDGILPQEANDRLQVFTSEFVLLIFISGCLVCIHFLRLVTKFKIEYCCLILFRN